MGAPIFLGNRCFLASTLCLLCALPVVAAPNDRELGKRSVQLESATKNWNRTVNEAIVDAVGISTTPLVPINVTPSAYLRNQVEAPGAIQVRIESATGCRVQVSATTDGARGIRLNTLSGSDLQIQALNRATGGIVLGDFDSYSSVSANAQNIWRNSEPNDPFATAFSIGLRIKSLSSYHAGEYSASLLFTVIPD